MEINYKKLGLKIKEKRKKLGYTQESLSEKLNLSVSHLSHIENGSAKVSLNTLVNIANILNLSLDELFSIDFSNNFISENIKDINEFLKNCSKEEKKLLFENLNFLKKVNLKEKEYIL